MFRQFGRNVLKVRQQLAQDGLQCKLLIEQRCWISRSQTLESIKVKMPSLSPTMTEGTIVKWTKQPGEEVTAGDVLCEIQTDKAVVALEADEDGTLAKVFRDQDSGTLQVGTLIALMADPDENWESVAKETVEDEGASQPAAPNEDATAEEAAPSGGSTPGIEVKMPSLSPTMTEGTIVKWCFKEGDKVSPGDVLAEIQTDKAVVSMEVDDEAVLAKILIPEGEETVQVGQLIALMVHEDEDWKDVQIPAPQKPSSPAAEAKPKEEETPKADSDQKRTAKEHHFEHVPKVGPATNLLLAQYGIKASDVPATGPKGLVKSDVLNYIKSKGLKPIEIQADSPEVKGEESAKEMQPQKKPMSGYTDHPLSSMRSVIAKRLSESKKTSPHGHATAASNINAIMRLRKQFAARGIKVSVNDFVVKAVAMALQHVPEMNLNVSGEDFQIMPNIDISIAVATPTGLITPIVRDVPGKTIPQISNEIKTLAGKARDGKLQPQEFQGGTFTVSNLGMFGVTEFTAIINPPQVGILAVGGGFPEIDPETGKAVTLMRSTLSFDRRFIDEALAADFMSTFQTVIEQPEFLNLGMEPIVRKDRVESNQFS